MAKNSKIVLNWQMSAAQTRKRGIEVMEISAWGESKDVMEWLDDPRIHPSVTRDVLVKRIKRGTIQEIALTKGVCDEARIGDNKLRIKARHEKNLYRARMFVIAQEVRKKYGAGVEPLDLQQRYDISKSQLEKFISGNEYYNVHWAGSSIPDEFKELVREVREAKAGQQMSAAPITSSEELSL
jgi:hypothetical protein